VDPLTFIAKLIGATARVGGAIALAAIVVYVGRRAGLGFFVGLNGSIYQGIEVAGLVGACIVAVELIIAAGKALRWIGRKLSAAIARQAERRNQRALALRNMEALTPPFALTLKFLKSQGLKRFPAQADNDLLFQMRQAFLLTTDDPNLTPYSTQTYYLVPDYVWDAIDTYASDIRPPPHAPWIRLPDPQGWMRR
jgi:hypothetical protein